MLKERNNNMKEVTRKKEITCLVFLKRHVGDSTKKALGHMRLKFYFVATLPYSPALWRVQFRVVQWTDAQVSVVELSTSFRVIVGLFVVFLINVPLP